jgi:hypothetical protein
MGIRHVNYIRHREAQKNKSESESESKRRLSTLEKIRRFNNRSCCNTCNSSSNCKLSMFDSRKNWLFSLLNSSNSVSSQDDAKTPFLDSSNSVSSQDKNNTPFNSISSNKL